MLGAYASRRRALRMRLRVTETRPSDRDRLYVSARAGEATAWSFFDVLNSKLTNLFDDVGGDTSAVGHSDD